MMEQKLESKMLHTLASHVRRLATMVGDKEGLQILFMTAHKLDTRAEEIDRDGPNRQ